MKAAITGGGTAGHVTPLLAIASEIKLQNSDATIIYIGQHKDPMRSIIEDNRAIDKHYSILAGKFRRYHGIGLWRHLIDIKTNLKNARDFVYFISGFIQSLVIFVKNRPDILFVKGGFVGLPVGLAAALLKIPIITHDSDSIPGLTNKVLSKYARLMAVGMPVDFYKDIYNPEKLRFSGIPVRQDFIDKISKNQARDSYSLNSSDKVIAVIGGSLGAVRLNQYIYDNLENLAAYKLLWVTGERSYNMYRQKIKNNNIQLFSFSDDLANIIRSADVVVSRAGATTIAELAIMAKPTILVPNPILAGGHQSINAQKLAQLNAVLMIDEYKLENNSQLLGKAISELINNEQLLNELSINIAKIAVPDAGLKITKFINEALSI